MIIAKHLSSRQLTLPHRLCSQLTFVYMYIYIYVAVVSHAQQCRVQECNYWLKLKHVHLGFWHVSFWLAAWVLSRSMVLFATRTLGGSRLWFSTLKINGWTCVAIRACRARAATCGAEQWALNMFIPQLHTLQVTKICSGPINEARVRDIRAISAGNARAATVELNSECGWHIPHSHLYTCKRLSGCTLRMWHARSMIGICIVSNTTTSWLVMWCCDWAGTNRFCYGLDNKAWVDTVNVGFCCCENSPSTKWDVITIPSGTIQV